MKHFYLIISILMAFQSYGQKILTGKIVDEMNLPVLSANVVLFSLPDSAFLKGISTTETGEFQIEIEEIKKPYYSIISFIGYEPVILNSPAGDIGTIRLQPQLVQLKEATITAKRPTIVSKSDRTIVNVSGSILENASDGIEMLRKTPRLISTAQQGIAVAGKGAPVIYIDGKEVYDMQEVKMLNPQNVKSIEIIDNPSSAYDASGNAVVLIHTVKNRDDLYVRTGGALKSSRRLSEQVYGELSVTKKKVTSSLYYGFSDDRLKTYETNYRYQHENLYLGTDEQGWTNSLNHTYKASVDYNLSAKHVLGIQTNGFFVHDREEYNQQTSFFDVGTPFATKKKNKNRQYQIDVTGYYTFAVDTLGQNLKVVADITRQETTGRNKFRNIIEDTREEDALLNQNNNDNEVSIYALQADYVKPFNEKYRGEIGTKYYLINNTTQTNLTGSTNLLQGYKTKEQNFAAYVSLSADLSKALSLRAGIRSEYTVRNGMNNNVTTVDTKHWDFFPSLLLNYMPYKDLVLGISYTKRISRPTLSSLDPSLVIDSLTNRQGNPYLKSANTHAFMFSFSPVKSLTFRFNYNIRLDPIYFVAFQDAEHPQVLNVRYENSEKTKSYLVDAMWDKNLFNWWSMSVYTYIWRGFYKYQDYGVEKWNKKPMWYGSIQNTFLLPFDIGMDVGFYYNNGGSSGVLKETSSWNLYASIQKKFLKNRLNVSLSANDIFRKSIGEQHSVLPGKNWNIWDGDETYIRLSLSYRFGKSSYKYKSQSISDSEKNRMN